MTTVFLYPEATFILRKFPPSGSYSRFLPRLSPLESKRWHPSCQPALPWAQTWDPQSTGLLGAESIWCKACLERHACSSSEWLSVNIQYSNRALGRSARFGSAWSGGEVESVNVADSGMEATKLLRRPRRRLALYRMSHEVL